MVLYFTEAKDLSSWCIFEAVEMVIGINLSVVIFISARKTLKNEREEKVGLRALLLYALSK